MQWFIKPREKKTQFVFFAISQYYTKIETFRELATTPLLLNTQCINHKIVFNKFPEIVCNLIQNNILNCCMVKQLYPVSGRLETSIFLQKF